jgi:hypothetical protein
MHHAIAHGSVAAEASERDFPYKVAIQTSNAWNSAAGMARSHRNLRI